MFFPTKNKNKKMLKVSPVNPLPERLKFCNNCKHCGVKMTPLRNEIKCKLYYTLDLVNGEKKYENAHDVRQDDQKCGKDAKYFEGLTNSDNLHP